MTKGNTRQKILDAALELLMEHIEQFSAVYQIEK